MAGILAGLDVEVVAIAFLFALLVGVLIVRPLLVSVLAQAPLIGGWLAGNVDAGLAAFEQAIQPGAAAALGALSATIDWLASSWGSLVSLTAGLGELTYTALWRIVNLKLPELEGRAAAFASGLYDQLRALVQADVASLEVQLSADLAKAEAEAGALFSEAETLARDLDAAQRALLADSLAVAEQLATVQVEAERAFVVDQVLGVRAEIQSAFAQALAVSAAAEAALQGDIGAVERDLGGAIQADVNALLKQIAADKAALEAALAGGLAGVIADIAAIRALRCLQFCDQLADLGSLLNNLDAGLLIAFVAYAKTHPGEAGAFLRAEALPLIKDYASGVEALIGG